MDLSKLSLHPNSPNHAFNSPASQSRFTGNSPALSTALITMQDYNQQLRVQQMYAAAEVARYRSLVPAGPSGFPVSSSLPNLSIHFPPFPYNTLSGYGAFPAGYPRSTLMSRFLMRDEQPKPTYSYIGLIGMAILSSPERRMILSDIYQWILDHYPYFRTRAPGWKNSIRHNLSLNACFVKCARSATGKGHYWAVHPANVKDFERGDFRRRKAQQKVHRMMGISAPDEEDEDDSPCASISDEKEKMNVDTPSSTPSPRAITTDRRPVFVNGHRSIDVLMAEDTPYEKETGIPKRKGFDMESLLAPDSGHEKSKPNSENTGADVGKKQGASEPENPDAFKGNRHKQTGHSINANEKPSTESKFPPCNQSACFPFRR